jgi:hypothetical protein
MGYFSLATMVNGSQSKPLNVVGGDDMTNQPNELENKLFNKTPSDISERDAKVLIEQYKLYVEMMDKVSERRHQANSFFLTVNTILITALTGFISLTRQSVTQYGWIIVAAIVGVVFCLTWRRLIHSYGQLNSGKFKIIHLLETRLPARLFDAEWDALNRGDGTVYKPFTRTEIRVPLAFAMLYGLLAFLVVLDFILGIYSG